MNTEHVEVGASGIGPMISRMPQSDYWLIIELLWSQHPQPLLFLPLSPLRCVLCRVHGHADAQPDQVYSGGEAAAPQ